jgi:hypothetical protein
MNHSEDPISIAYREGNKSPKKMFQESMKQLLNMKKKCPGMPTEEEMKQHDDDTTELEDYRVSEHNKLIGVKT